MRHFLAGFADELIKTAADTEKLAVSRDWISRKVTDFALGNRSSLSGAQRARRLKDFAQRHKQRASDIDLVEIGRAAPKHRHAADEALEMVDELYDQGVKPPRSRRPMSTPYRSR